MSGLKQATAYTSGAKINRSRPRNKTKGANIMFKWFAKKIRNALREIEYENDAKISPAREVDSHARSSDERITLRLEKAIGGHIISVTKYNGKIDRHRENVYLIKDDDNLEESLAGIFISEKLSM